MHYCSPYITRNLHIANYKYSLNIYLHISLSSKSFLITDSENVDGIKEYGNELDINVTLYALNILLAFQDGIYRN